MVIMVRKKSFELIYAPVTKSHLRAIEKKYYSLIRASVEKELGHDPGVQTANRKPLKRQVAFEAEWELRFGPDNKFRVFYDIDMESRRVYVLAIGVKERNRLSIGGKEVTL